MSICSNQCVKEDWDEKSTSTDEKDDETFFEIDVKPKKRFETIEQKQYIEEYTKKKKTELCKNYQALGYCKFGDECSFAHGERELQPKIHLHQNYKTKACVRYFNEGFCPYGLRCQYLHNEIVNQQKFDRYLLNCYKQNGMKPPISQSKLKIYFRTFKYLREIGHIKVLVDFQQLLKARTYYSSSQQVQVSQKLENQQTLSS